MTRIRFCDCAGLHALIGAHKRARAEGRQVRLAVTGAQVRRILALTALDRLIPVCTSLDQALAHPPAAQQGPPVTGPLAAGAPPPARSLTLMIADRAWFRSPDSWPAAGSPPAGTAGRLLADARLPVTPGPAQARQPGDARICRSASSGCVITVVGALHLSGPVGGR